MRQDKGRTFLYFLLLAGFCFGLHKAVFQYYFAAQATGLIYSLELLYVFFASASLFILALVLFIDNRNHDQTGMSFLLITTVKMVGCYILARPLLARGTLFEKTNFLFLFILFLSIETILTIRILNKKQ